jgi:hypothetical protein
MTDIQTKEAISFSKRGFTTTQEIAEVNALPDLTTSFKVPVCRANETTTLGIVI